MSAFRVFVLALMLVPIIASSAVKGQLKSDWDTVRFALAIALTDNFDDSPVITVHRLQEGGNLLYKNGGRVVSRSLSDAEIETLVSQLLRFFKDAELLLPNQQIRPVDHFEMLLTIDDGFSRMSYHRDLPMEKPPQILIEYREFIQRLTAASPPSPAQPPRVDKSGGH